LSYFCPFSVSIQNLPLGEEKLLNEPDNRNERRPLNGEKPPKGWKERPLIDDKKSPRDWKEKLLLDEERPLIDDKKPPRDWKEKLLLDEERPPKGWKERLPFFRP
jgi:hypothetical protein